MKILHINTSDTNGGAAIAALRLHRAMLAEGLDSYFFCLNRSITDDERILSISGSKKYFVKFSNVLKNKVFQKFNLRPGKGIFSSFNIGYSIKKTVNLNEFDIIYLHWVNGQFINFKSLEEILKTGKKVYWFMHDMFPITGGCHYAFDCQGFKNSCGSCPNLKKPSNKDFSYKQLKKKIKLLSKYPNLSFVGPSKWLSQMASAAALCKGHKVYHIPNVLDSSIFKPSDKAFCRNLLNLSQDKKIILFGAQSALTNVYKGFSYLKDAMDILAKDSEIAKDSIQVLLFGSSYNKEIADLLPFDCRFLGTIHDEVALNLIYNSADLFCIPSLQENFANTIMESIHCHTPVVGFDVGGIPDNVGPDTGYLAEYKNAADLAKGIKTLLKGDKKFDFNYLENVTVKKVISEHKKMWSESE